MDTAYSTQLIFDLFLFQRLLPHPEPLRPQLAQVFRFGQCDRFVGGGQGGPTSPAAGAGRQVHQGPAPVPRQADPRERGGRGVQVAAACRSRSPSARRASPRTARA